MASNKQEQQKFAVSAELLSDEQIREQICLHFNQLGEIIHPEKLIIRRYPNQSVIVYYDLEVNGSPQTAILAAKPADLPSLQMMHFLPVGYEVAGRIAKEYLDSGFRGPLGREFEYFAQDLPPELQIELNKQVLEIACPPVDNIWQLGEQVRQLVQQYAAKYQLYAAGWPAEYDPTYEELNDENPYVQYMIDLILAKFVRPEGEAAAALDKLAQAQGFAAWQQLIEEKGLAWLKFAASHVHIGFPRIAPNADIYPMEMLQMMEEGVGIFGRFLEMVTYSGPLADGVDTGYPDARTALKYNLLTGRNFSPRAHIPAIYADLEQALTHEEVPTNTIGRGVLKIDEQGPANMAYGLPGRLRFDIGTSEYTAGSATDPSMELARDFMLQCVQKLVMMALREGYNSLQVYLHHKFPKYIHLFNANLTSYEYFWEYSTKRENTLWFREFRGLWGVVLNLLDAQFGGDEVYEYGKEYMQQALRRMYASVERTQANQVLGLGEYDRGECTMAEVVPKEITEDGLRQLLEAA